MKFIKYIPLIAFLVTVHNTSAQLRPGIEAGANYSTFSLTNTNNGNQYIPGFHVRAVAEFVLNDLFSLESAVGYTTRGYKYYDETSASIFGYSTSSVSEGYEKINYLNLPILFKAGKAIGESRVYVGVGPDVYFALNGKYQNKTTTTISGNETINESKGSIDFKNDNVNKFDLAAKGIIGFEKNGIYIQACYEHGFIDIDNDPNTNVYKLNRNISLTLGFKLGGY